MFADVTALRAGIAGILNDAGATSRLTVLDEARLRGGLVDDLARTAALSPDAAARDAARWLIMEAAAALGLHSASLHDVYLAAGRGAWRGVTVPAHNIRMRTYATSRALFRAARRLEAGLFIFEIARSEIRYTFQRPAEYAAMVMAAAIKERHRGPVFIQGDHFQASAKKVAKDRDAEVAALRALIAEAVAAGFLNIDIDTSTLVDLTRPTVREQQRANFELGAELTRHVRAIEPRGVTVSVGGEIGEVGKTNSTVEELRAYMTGLAECLGGLTGVSKVSVQTGTTHGGLPLPDGSVAEVPVDFDRLEELSRCCREEFGVGGAVQHGASTLPEAWFDQFPRRGALEIHLATGFQNLVFEHARFPAGLREAMNAWLEANAQEENKAGYTREQFLYKARKKAWGPFKRETWDLPAADAQAIDAALEEKFAFLLGQLGCRGSAAVVDRHVRPVEIFHARPAGY